MSSILPQLSVVGHGEVTDDVVELESSKARTNCCEEDVVGVKVYVTDPMLPPFVGACVPQFGRVLLATPVVLFEYQVLRMVHELPE